jgi:hypothetical protein
MPDGTNAKDLEGALAALTGTYMNPDVANSGMSKENFERCYYYVLTKAKEYGTDPASAATVWVEESGASYCEKYPNVKDLGVLAGPFPNIESQVKLYSQLLGGYLFSPCGPPMTVDKYWMIYYGGHDFCQSGGSQEYDNWAISKYRKPG